MEWIDLEPALDRLQFLGAQRDEQHRKRRSTKNWSQVSTHFLGLCGEYAVSQATGLDFDEQLRPGGDGGADFRWGPHLYSVKATTYWEDPHLKEYQNPKVWCDFYILVGVDLNGKRVRIAGWTTCQALQGAPLRYYGHGYMLHIESKGLHPGLPPGLQEIYQNPVKQEAPDADGCVRQAAGEGQQNTEA